MSLGIMSLFEIFALVLSLAALFAYINERLFRLPNTIGIMLIGLLMSVVLVIAGQFWPGLDDSARSLLKQIDFDQTVLQGMLSFLLFAGALHVNLNDLIDQKWVVGLLATLGVMISTVLVGLMTWGLSQLLGLNLSLLHSMVFGALISPTDPIAVLGILKKLGAPKDLETMITGESLFNDGVGVVVFLVLAGIAFGGESASVSHAFELFAVEALGGAVFGLVLGYLCYLALKSIDNYHIEVLISLATVAGGYALAAALHLSGPIAIVIAGLFAGNQGRRLAMSEVTRRRLDDFWELIDEILNAVLFLLIGLEVLVLSFEGRFLLAGLLAIPLILMIRSFAVGVPMMLLRWKRRFPNGAVPILTWGGLRGGISVALALSLPDIAARDAILTMTYLVVAFSIIVQGLTIGKLIKKHHPGLKNE